MKGFKEIENYPEYRVNKRGVVISNKKGRWVIKNPQKIKSGYLFVPLYKNGVQKTMYIHRLVAICFIPNPFKKPEINHKNGVKSDNKVDNLEWCTSSENKKHAFRTGLNKISDANKKNKKKTIETCSIPICQYDLSGKLLKVFKSSMDVERAKIANQTSISNCLRGRCITSAGFIWKYKNK